MTTELPLRCAIPALSSPMSGRNAAADGVGAAILADRGPNDDSGINLQNVNRYDSDTSRPGSGAISLRGET